MQSSDLVSAVCIAFFILIVRICSAPSTDGPIDSDGQPISVLIIGAGASGLAAAQTLVYNGVEDFVILEAADRIGGRVHDIEFGGIRVERGANWAQPVDGIVQKLVWEEGMQTHQSNWFSMVVYNSTGHNVTEESLPVWNQTTEAITKALSIASDLLASHDTDMSVRSALRSIGWNPMSEMHKTIEWALLDFENGDIPEFTSLKENAMMANEFKKRVPDDEKPTLVIDQRGYKYLFNATMPFLSDKNLSSNILLNKKVRTIDQSSGDDVIVTCDDGQVFRASRILVTVSLGVLQNSRITFIPELPDWKIRTLNRFRMAVYSKIYLKFPINFWGDREIIFHTSDHRGRYPIFTNLEAKGLFPVGTNILMAEITGAEAERVESLSDDVIKCEIEAVLRVMFGEGIPNATDILVSGWSRNPLVLGSYSLWPPEIELECFRAKMKSRVNNIFFAGECTSEDNGYVQGALESGVREGLKIVNCRTNGEDCPQWSGGNQSCFCNAANILSFELGKSFELHLFVSILYIVVYLIEETF
ncbi:uncharacterized protein [Antedon mediterranea]|uniref:uncharacterized protein n=1 Tax=Antedon mediterranea TaxID=105859 RepID=UPI003AF974B1